MGDAQYMSGGIVTFLEAKKLMKKREELQSREQVKAFADSERSFGEVMGFLAGKEVDDE